MSATITTPTSMKPYCSISGWIIGLGLFFVLSFVGPDVKCRDGWSSPSIGRQGACSHHGGVNRNGWFTLLSLVISVSAGVYTTSKLNEREKRIEERRRASQQKTNEPLARQNPQANSTADGFKQTEMPPLPKISIKCPRCESEMREIQIKTGTHKGKKFLSCSNYPNCKMVIHQNEKGEPK